MKRILLFLCLYGIENTMMGQYVYTINADSVKITNHCDTAELILENHTQNVSGFLFNKGRGRTEFRKTAIALNDSTWLLGTDTLHTNRPSFWKAGTDLTLGQGIYNTNAGNVGIATVNPQRTLDVNGVVRVESGLLELTNGPRCGIRQTCLATHIFNGCGTLGYISLGFDSITGVATGIPDPLTVKQQNLSVGINIPNPLAKLHIRGAGVSDTMSSLLVDNNTGTDLLHVLDNGMVGIHRAKPAVLLDLPGPVNIDDTSSYRINYHPILQTAQLINGVYTNLFVGDQAGSPGQNQAFVGASAGTHNTGSYNSFVGYAAGQTNTGDECTFSGYMSGANSYSVDQYGYTNGYNSFFGSASGQNNKGGANTYLGVSAGGSNNGGGNVGVGSSSGYNNNGSFNVSLGVTSGFSNRGDNNILIGSYAGEYNTGNNNVLMGDSTGWHLAGTENIFIGAKTGYSSVTANSVTLLGVGADVGQTNISNATAVGHHALVGASNTMVFGDTATHSWLFNSNANAAAGAFVVGYNSTNGNGAYLTTGGVWTNASDRNKKENFQPVDPDDLLERISRLPISRWNYKGLQEQHIGPVAQDFYSLFRLGNDDKTISTIDPSGIALAGIKGLYGRWQEAIRKTTEQQQKISELETVVQQQQAQIDRQQSQLNQLSEALNSLQAALAKGK